AQISNRGGARHGARYYSADKAVTCRNCGRAGHLSKNCPAPKACPEIWRQYHLTVHCALQRPDSAVVSFQTDGVVHFGAQLREAEQWRGGPGGVLAAVLPELWPQSSRHTGLAAGPLGSVSQCGRTG
ncbi:hypothetical protein Q9233_017323, partial [Columba guinea]